MSELRAQAGHPGRGGSVPFTGSHPAAIVPLLRLGLPTSALVIGSVSPDLPYYFRMPVTSAETHSLSGVVSWDLGLGLGVFLVWHLLLVPPLVWAAPARLQRRIPDHWRGGLAPRLSSTGDLGRVCLALIIGALTHVAWDLLTHTNRWSQRVLPWLDTTILGLALYRWLHIASSLAGLALLGWCLVRWWHDAPTASASDPVRPAIRWTLAVLLVGGAALATALVAADRVLDPGRVSRQVLLIDSLIAFLSTIAVGLVGAAIAWHVWRAVRRDRERVNAEHS